MYSGAHEGAGFCCGRRAGPEAARRHPGTRVPDIHVHVEPGAHLFIY